MKVTTRLAIGYAVLMALLVLPLAHHLWVIRRIAADNQRLSETSLRLYAGATSEMLVLLDELEETSRKWEVTRDSGYLRVHDRARAAFRDTLALLRGLELSGDEADARDGLVAAWEGSATTAAGADSIVPGIAGARGPATASGPWVGGTASAALPGLRARTTELRRASEAALLSHIRRTSVAARNAERVSRLAIAAAVVLSVIVSVLLVRSISEAIGGFQRATHAVAEGDFSTRLDESRGDEFATLARDFNLMARRLAEVEEAKRRFFTSVSHDLKSPLVSMQETANLLLEGLPGPLNAKQRRLLELSLKSGERLRRMISNLLDLARMEAGAIEYRMARHDVGRLCRTVAERFLPRAAERRITLGLDVAPRPLPAQCDGDRVQQVLENLLDNALRHAAPGGAVVVRCRAAARPLPSLAARLAAGAEAPATGFILVQVSDDGAGVPDGEKERIFERFHQIRSEEKVAGAGVGLGLAICREIAHAHGGAVGVDDAPGGGAVFSVILPAAAGARAVAAAPEPPAAERA